MPTINEIKIIKLMSGEEIIGKILESPENKTSLGKCFQVLVMPHEDGTQQLALLPFHIHSNLHEKMTIKNEHIIFEYRPSQQMVDIYNRFTSPIIQANNSGLITA